MSRDRLWESRKEHNIRKLRIRGFSLMEVLFAVVILSIASMGVMGVLTFGVVAGDTAGNMSTANQISREMVENIRVDGNFNFFRPNFPAEYFSDQDQDRTALDAEPFNDDSEFNIFSDPRFTRNIQITEVAGQNLARIQVRVFWEQNGTERSVETVAFQRR